MICRGDVDGGIYDWNLFVPPKIHVLEAWPQCGSVEVVDLKEVGSG